MKRLYVRDCYQQIKSIRRLLLSLTDDLGDLSIDRNNPDSTAHAELMDYLSEVESRLHKAQETLRETSEAQ